jgi:hypothetical protein
VLKTRIPYIQDRYTPLKTKYSGLSLDRGQLFPFSSVK